METCFVVDCGEEGIQPLSLVIKRILFLLWLMVPHKQLGVWHTVFEALFNQQLSHSINVVENSFKISKKML
jgi:hypothetical protein